MMIAYGFKRVLLPIVAPSQIILSEENDSDLDQSEGGNEPKNYSQIFRFEYVPITFFILISTIHHLFKL